MTYNFAEELRKVMNSSEVRGYCQTRGREGGGVCRLNKQDAPPEPVNEWQYDKNGDWNQVKNRGSLYLLSGIICREIELWLNGLWKSKSEGGKIKLRGCSYEEYKRSLTSARCHEGDQRKNSLLEWSEFGSRDIYSPIYPSQKSFMICLDIVRIILMILATPEKASKEKETSGNMGNLCRRIYHEFNDWGGEAMARKLMKRWFKVKTKKRRYQTSLILPGGTLYDAVRASILNRRAGQGGLVCVVREEKPRKLERSRANEPLRGPIEYHTERRGSPQRAPDGEDLVKAIGALDGTTIRKRQEDLEGRYRTRGIKVRFSKETHLFGAVIGVLLAAAGIYGVYNTMRRQTIRNYRRGQRSKFVFHQKRDLKKNTREGKELEFQRVPHLKFTV
ncbi:hypothetical protein C922_05523 [Plasmodium inui San Antonio 1]|uniref:Uncharacterized protein n=1 Tax=Plasmodium inui San Antonio 1 TaxID=1237626 RepID=W7AFN5_9APIC|nr:hypothetical protein C922_05523 [Plasmodium inui San Antonio 1]EUD64096.1 hypothetical protein C922_05523 [Plasmodium inui San Antonio 1]